MRKEVIGKNLMFFKPEKSSVAWAKSCLSCGLKSGVSLDEIVELLDARGYAIFAQLN